ncbi:Protein of unknown function [Bacillus cytotoxicus]|uniref:Uncharacterized protein n=1 Tax=Bacillus cytotoxicus TaxID=580165 RepID=A0AAX2CFX0_9BACI|nr:Protein of unknown function [Bacillus cytotoxicus]SCN35320.1 Protein of unknown function [Bacillus cytotoxicus]
MERYNLSSDEGKLQF